jgi:hydroxyquinol 1,2-dioxygenase
VFGVRSQLITAFERHEPGVAADGVEMDAPYSTMTYDLVLEPSR